MIKIPNYPLIEINDLQNDDTSTILHFDNLRQLISEVLLHGVNSKDFEFEDLIIPLRSLHTDFALIVGIMENLNEDLRIDSFEKCFMTHIERQLPVITT